ncbi:MAG: NAD(P)H-hydrate dehydratase [Pseudomonadota bacterium]
MSRVGPDRFYTAEESRAVDKKAMTSLDCGGPALMARAARCALAVLLSRYGEIERVQILCGPGNNGGDGLLLATLLQDRNIPVQVFLIAGEPRTPDARLAYNKALSAAVSISDFEEACLQDAGIVVDAMLGTGVQGALRESFVRAVGAVNELGRPTVSLDVPTGVDSDTGHVSGVAINADVTLSFITAKRGLYTATAPDFTGDLVVDDLDVPLGAFDAAPDACLHCSLEPMTTVLSARSRAAHKGHFGKCLVVGGDHGMGGATILAAEAALRTGAGLVRVATRSEHLTALLTRRPECMAVPVEHRNDLEPWLAWTDVIVLGPGLGQGAWGEQLLQLALGCGKTMVLDADALNLISSHRYRLEPSPEAPIVVTPHPAEAARLLGENTAFVQADRFSAARMLASGPGVVAVLKGNGTLVSDGDSLSLCTAGNPGMASGGMGDVLSGIIGGVLAQAQDAFEGAQLAVALHSIAADRAAHRLGERSLLASDVVEQLGALLR